MSSTARGVALQREVERSGPGELVRVERVGALAGAPPTTTPCGRSQGSLAHGSRATVADCPDNLHPSGFADKQHMGRGYFSGVWSVECQERSGWPYICARFDDSGGVVWRFGEF